MKRPKQNIGSTPVLLCLLTACILLRVSGYADSTTTSNITTQVLTTDTYREWWLYDGFGGDWGSNPTKAFYEQAQADCDTDTATCVSNWNAYAAFDSHRTCKPGTGNVNVYAKKRHTKQHLDIDLSAYTTNDCIRAYLDWGVDSYAGREGDGDHDPPLRSLSRPLPLGGVTNIIESFSVSGWMPWGQWQGYQTTYDQIGHWVSWPAPKIVAEYQTKDVRPEMINPQSCLAGTREPINTINGAVYFSETDIVVPAPGLPLAFRRTYNSQLDYDGPLGHRWAHSLDWHLYEDETELGGETNTWQVLSAGDGRRFWFEEQTNGAYTSPFDNNWQLTDAMGGGYRVTFPAGVFYDFDTNGVLLSMADPSGNVLTCTYTNSYPSNALIRVEHSNGQYLTISNANGRISGVLSPTNALCVTFIYNAQGELTNVTRTVGADTQTRSYLYDSDPSHYNHSLTQRVNATGHEFAYRYATDASGETTSVGIGMVLGTESYEHTVAYAQTIEQTTVTYSRGDDDQGYIYRYHPLYRRVEAILGPNATNWQTEAGKRFQYDDQGNVTNATTYDWATGEWLTRSTLYDASHNPTNVGIGYGAVPSNSWTFTWNTNDDTLASAADPEGAKTEFEYDDGLLTASKLYYATNACYTNNYGYLTNGLLTGATNANGSWICYTYDAYGFPTSVVPKAGPAVRMQYSRLGHIEKIEMPPYAYVPPAPPSTNYTYAWRTTELESDELGRVGRITYPNGQYEIFLYNAVGDMTNHVDIGGRTNKYTYAPTARLTSMTRTLVGASSNTDVTVSFAYDNQFNTLAITDALGRAVESYHLDLRDRPVAVTNLESQGMSVTYSVGDFVDEIARSDGTTVDFRYDTDANLRSVIYPDATNAFTYLKNGLLATAGNAEGSVSNTYNAANRLTASVGTAPSGTVSYTHFPAGQVSNVSSVAGNTTYALDGADRVLTIGTPVGTFTNTYNVNNGLVESAENTDTGISVAYAYDDVDCVTSIVWRNESNDVLRSFAYEYTDAGMIESVTREGGESTAYGYDTLDRLTNEAQKDAGGGTNRAECIQYDLAGNRTSKTRDGVTLNYTLGAGNRLASWAVSGSYTTLTVDVVGYIDDESDIGTGERYGELWVSNSVAVTPTTEGSNFWAYGLAVGLGTQQIAAAICDEAGNMDYVTNSLFQTLVTNAAYLLDSAGCMTSITYNGTAYTKTTELAWNGQYQLTSVDVDGSTVQEYAYDALARRVRVITGSTTNHLVYDGIHPIAEVDSTGNPKKTYTWGPGIDNLLAFTTYSASETNTYYALTDHLGTVHAVTDEDGEIVESYRYDAWGRVLGVYDGDGAPLDESAIGNHYLWQGRWYSWETGLYYFRARWYDPVTGRWLSKDPIGISGGLNQYVFCYNNPVNFIDPLGLDALFLVGRNIINPRFFTPKAEAIARRFEKQNPGQQAHVVQVRSFDDVQNALRSHQNITRLDYFGHGEPGELHLSSDVVYNEDVCKLDKSNTSQLQSINLWSCDTAAGGQDSMAQAFANHFGAPTVGATAGTSWGFNIGIAVLFEWVPRGTFDTRQPNQVSPGRPISTVPSVLLPRE